MPGEKTLKMWQGKMVEYYPWEKKPEQKKTIIIDKSLAPDLELEAFSNMFSKMSRSYKLLWFRSILEGVRAGEDEQAYGDIVNRMAADAWIPVVHHQVNLGLADAVERLISTLRMSAGVKDTANREEILSALTNSRDETVEKLRRRLVELVPYQLLSPFMKDKPWEQWDNYDLTIERINNDPKMIYSIGPLQSLETRIRIRPAWMKFLAENMNQVTAWTEYCLIEFLRKQNTGRKMAEEILQPRLIPATEVCVPNTENADKSVDPQGHKGRKMLTPKQKLWRRIKREFPKKKLLGDIVISDEEFELLAQELTEQYRRLIVQPERFEADEIFCVALVQFGIRYYSDGAYWPNVEQRINPRHNKTPFSIPFGNAFLQYMEDHRKLLCKEKKAVSNILLHGFVSDRKATDMFNFLYAYYSIDLARDINNLNRDAMNALVEAVKANDGRNRTYNLVEHTADAVRLNEVGCKIRLRRYLRLIDKASWNQDSITSRSENRLMKRFVEWCNDDDELITKERKAGRNYLRTHKHGWKPYLSYDYETDLFRLILPARLVQAQEEPQAYWKIRCGGEEGRLNTTAEKAVTGYITKELSALIHPSDIFSAFEFSFFCDDQRSGPWKIDADLIRFFGIDGDCVDPKMLRAGDYISFSAPDYIPESEARMHTDKWGELIRSEYSFADGDLIVFPDRKVLNIGKKPAEGLMKRGLCDGVYGQKEDGGCSVYASVPSLFARILPRSMNGTQLWVNGTCFRVFENGRPAEGVISIDLQERAQEEGVHISLLHFGVQNSGLYHIVLDIPNDHKNRSWDFLLINGLEYSFEEAPYIFAENGVLCVPDYIGLEPLDSGLGKPEHEEGQLRIAFRIPEDDAFFRLSIKGIPVAFEIPKLSYRLGGEEAWRTQMQVSFWHSELPETLEIKYPAESITILLDEEGNDDEDDEQHSADCEWNSEKGCFVCNLHPFKSWIGKQAAVRRLYVLLPGMTKPSRLMNIYTKNVFISANLIGDYKNDAIHGKFDIVGKAANYVDLWFGEQQLLNREPVVDGKITLHTNFSSGMYRVDIYTAEQDEDDFDEPDYDLLTSQNVELLNPSHLEGKHIEIKKLLRNNSDTYLRLKLQYTVYDLKPMINRGKGYYTGHMVVRVQDSEEYRDDYQVCIYIADPDELDRGFLFIMDRYGDDCSLLYDNDRHILCRNEEKGVSRVIRYSRYVCLWDDIFTFQISFVDKPDDLEKRLGLERVAFQKGTEQREEQKESQRELDPLCKPITQIGLPIALANELIREDILYTTDLKNMNMYELSRIEGLNRSDIEKCIVALRRNGYSISMF